LSHLKQPGVLTVNLGTGAGLLEVVRTFEVASGRSIPYAVGGRRAGDAAICYADATLAQDVLGWKSTRPGIDRRIAFLPQRSPITSMEARSRRNVLRKLREPS